MPRRGAILKAHVQAVRKIHNTPETVPEMRVRAAAEEARKILGALQKGDSDALVEATLLQGVASGDIIAAAITEKLRLQRENLRLKQRIARTKLQLERQKLKALQALNRPKTSPEEIQNAIAEIYGLTPTRAM